MKTERITKLIKLSPYLHLKPRIYVKLIAFVRIIFVFGCSCLSVESVISCYAYDNTRVNVYNKVEFIFGDELFVSKCEYVKRAGVVF